MSLLPTRQIHLDFHTSGFIPNVAKNFDAETFVRTFKDASVNSVTVFARCHHGYLYYQSKANPERIHPHLQQKNLMLDQIDALHAAGIRAPVYTAIQWDRYTAENNPEWLVRKPSGEHEGGPFTEPGFYQSLCVNTGYWGFIETHVRELCTLLKGRMDGFFFDIANIRPCLCHKCLPMMGEKGLDVNDNIAIREFTKERVDAFKQRLSALVREYSKDCTIFYNAGHIGPCTKTSVDSYSHFELESLPAGHWGYLHFPITARYARTLGKACIGQTGKFHTDWGDFHSIKNQAALEFEIFQMLSYGFAVSIGDQLEPNGAINPITYKLIKNVYSRVAQYEEWTRPSIPIVEAAVITSEPVLYEAKIPDSIMGLTQMLEELALQFDILGTDARNLSKYRLIILPDDLIIDVDLQKCLDAYVAAGGAILACYKGGSNPAGDYPACFGAISHGENENYPDFIIANGPMAANLEQESEYVIYKPGLKITASRSETKTILEARTPYFPRKGEYFCSHKYTPSGKGESYPAVFQNGNVILFGHPIFEQYRHNAPKWCKTLIDNAISMLRPHRLVRHNGPSTMKVHLMEQPEKGRIIAHLLSYIPVRKSATIDIIEERTTLRDVRLAFCLSKDIKSAQIVPDGTSLKLEGNTVVVPEVDGYAIVELSV